MLTVTHKAVDEGDFVAWVKTASPGQSCLYHDGDLASNRLHEGGKSLRTLKAMKIDVLAKAAHRASADGLVYLVQQRIEASRYEYVAVRSSKGHKQNAPQPESAAA